MIYIFYRFRSESTQQHSCLWSKKAFQGLSEVHEWIADIDIKQLIIIGVIAAAIIVGPQGNVIQRMGVQPFIDINVDDIEQEILNFKSTTIYH